MTARALPALRRSTLLLLCGILPLAPAAPASAQSGVLDDFSDIGGWHPVTSEGAKVALSQGEGKTGRALVMDFDLTGVYGYVIAEKAFTFDLPGDYQFTFDMRGETPVNNFEFKLTDDRGNVHWIKRLNIDYPREWTKQRITRRHIKFAWGPSGGGEIHTVRKIEFVVSCGTGGKGRVSIDNFRFELISDSARLAARAEVVAALPARDGFPSIDPAGTSIRNWRTGPAQDHAVLTVDFHHPKEVGGLVIEWDSLDYAVSYDVLLSDDGNEWISAYSVGSGNGNRDYVYMHECEGRFLRLDLKTSSRARGFGIREVRIKGPEFSGSPNDMFGEIASGAPPGYFPKYFRGRQSYWTIMGVSGDSKKALMNEEGQVEVGKGEFSIEPFLFIDNRLVTWSDVTTSQALLDGYIPFPQVTWTNNDGWVFTIQGTAAGVPGNSLLGIHYHLETKRTLGKGKIFIATRPFQVNPPWQSLNGEGGACRIDSIFYRDGFLDVNGRTIVPMTIPSAFGAAEFDQGDVTEFIAQGAVPPLSAVRDHFGHASGVLEYDFDLQADGSADVVLSVPFHAWRRSPTPNMSPGSPQVYHRLMTSTTAGRLKADLNRVNITLPPAGRSVAATVKSMLAYILIDRNGPALQPGSRNYDRSWIRDGALTCAALLRTGFPDEVRAFLDWYAQGQFPNGKIPCVIDSRGPDATPEHDSNGEFIYAVLQYYLFTKDTVWLRGKFDAVVKTVRFIQSLRSERKTDPYRNGTPEERALYGLVPQSISHEGYWDVPRHSYWDDFFILRGLKDAATIAAVLGEKSLEGEFAAERDDFRKDLYASMRMAMKNRNIDYIPGCAELGDFDATSTTIGVSPGGELGEIPEPELHNTFDRYYKFFDERKSTHAYVNYTPYETRVIGTFVRLGQKKRAAEALDFFMGDRRPASWNEWAEVVWRNPDTPKYIGDMPHTWVGSDFIRSVLDMFAYEREQDGALVIAAGIPDAWIRDSAGVSVERLRTYGGELSFSIRPAGKKVIAEISGTIDPSRWNLVIASPLGKPLKGVRVDGRAARVPGSGEMRIMRLPAKLEFTY
jgi:hypothetical protein